MSEYIEQSDKYTFPTSSHRKVNFSVDCHHGTIAEVSFFNDELKTVGCGEQITIGNGDELKDQIIEFNGASGNPDDSLIKVTHIIEEEDGDSMSYTFPDDFTGTPDFDDDDDEPSYTFYVHFT